jgi:hypothetical protein
MSIVQNQNQFVQTALLGQVTMAPSQVSPIENARIVARIWAVTATGIIGYTRPP